MRCLGRLVALVLLLIAAAAAWLYRDDVRRFVDRTLHPEAAAARIGRPSRQAYQVAVDKLGALASARQDSVILSADEMASLITRGTSFLPGATSDSITIELGDRAVRIRTVIDSARIPATYRRLIPGRATAYEEVVVRGALTPVRPGLAELAVQHVSVHGVPLPADVIGRLATQITGRGNDGRVDVAMPPAIGGFRIRPDGVAVYRPVVVK